MSARFQQYAQALVTTHGLEHAMDIVNDNLNIARKHGPDLTLFDEADWVFSSKTNTLIPPRENSKKARTAGNKEKRIKGNINFYTGVKIELERIAKNGRTKKGN